MKIQRRTHSYKMAATAAFTASAISFGMVTPAQAEQTLPAIAGAEAVPGYPLPVQHPGAPTPAPFSPDYVGGFISDISSHDYGVYVDVIDGFNDLRANHPDVMQQNLATTIRINNEAAGNPAAISRAQMDAAADKAGLLTAFSDALGEELGGHFRDALRENRLPKTNYLFGNGYLARAGGLASSTFAEKTYYGYERPFVVAPDKINRYNLPGEDFYGDSKAFPSGHTNQATWSTTLLALAVPELGPQLVARGSEAGYNLSLIHI